MDGRQIFTLRIPLDAASRFIANVMIMMIIVVNIIYSIVTAVCRWFALQASYDAELLALHELVQQKVQTLLSDPDNIVKRTLLMHGIKHLCVFFGRQKGMHRILCAA